MIKFYLSVLGSVLERCLTHWEFKACRKPMPVGDPHLAFFKYLGESHISVRCHICEGFKPSSKKARTNSEAQVFTYGGSTLRSIRVITWGKHPMYGGAPSEISAAPRSLLPVLKTRHRPSQGLVLIEFVGTEAR